MLRKIDEKILVEMIEKDDEYQEETLRLSQIRTKGRMDLLTGYWVTIQNFYIRKKKYLEAMEKDLTKK